MPTRDPGPLPDPPPPPDLSTSPGRLNAKAASRLLALAKEARRAVSQAVGKAGDPKASQAERETAAKAKACIDELNRRIPELDSAIANLEAFASGAKGLSLSLPQVEAIEAFVRCAEPMMQEASIPERVLTVAAGVGMPLVLSVALSLLRS